MKPDFISASSELISAMSAMNMHDDRKPYNGTFLTDDFAEVSMARNHCSHAFNLLEMEDDFFSDKDGAFNSYCDLAIKYLNEIDETGKPFSETHYTLAHAIEHIEAAKITYKEKKNV